MLIKKSDYDVVNNHLNQKDLLPRFEKEKKNIRSPVPDQVNIEVNKSRQILSSLHTSEL